MRNKAKPTVTRQVQRAAIASMRGLDDTSLELLSWQEAEVSLVNLLKAASVEELVGTSPLQ